MAEFQKVRGSYEISIRAADLLEDMRPQDYNGSNRAGTVRTINDILQGRAQRTVDSFLLGLRNTGGDGYAQRVEEVCQDVQAFLTQKALQSQPYTKTSNKQYKYRTFGLDPKHPLKIINQRLYDLAAKAGFPPGFFEQSYFDHVTIYCIPDGTRCSDSVFQDCTFSVCRLLSVEFWDARLNSCAFQSCPVPPGICQLHAKSFSKIAVIILNQIIRPFTAKWHREQLNGAFENKEKCAEFCEDLMRFQKEMRKYSAMLAEIAGVEDITEINNVY